MDGDTPMDWANEDRDIPEEFWSDCIYPVYWRVMIMPIRPRKVSRGGIVIAQEARDAQEHLNYVGKLVMMGGLAGKHERLQGEPRQPKIGDYVIYGRYAGQPMMYKGVKLLLCNDDEILGICPNPEALQIYI